MSGECHEEVTRKGYLEPCEKPAVALRIDPNEGRPYPVCVKHTRADMVPLRKWRELIAQEIWDCGGKFQTDDWNKAVEYAATRIARGSTL